MVKKSLPIEGINTLEVTSVNGDLYLTGWAKEEIQIKDLNNEDQYRIKKGRLEIQFPGDGVLHIPHNLPVKIKTVNGDAILKEIGSEIKIDTVNGDLKIRDLGSTVIDTIQGDLFAKRIQGDLQVKMINGDAQIDDIKGQVGLNKVNGDLFVEKVAGGLEAKANGDGMLDFNPVPWQAYQIQTGGDLSITMPEESNADLIVESQAHDIRLTFGELSVTSRDRKLSQQLGEGGPKVMLNAGGKVFILGDTFSMYTGIKMNMRDFGEFNADFRAHTSDQIKSSLDHLEVDLQESFSGLADTLEGIGISEEYLRDFDLKIEETSKLAAEKAELAAIKAQAKAERNIARARREMLKAQAKMKEFDLGDFLEDHQEKKAVNESERLLILEMLQEKKISLEEADQLLNALEGKK